MRVVFGLAVFGSLLPALARSQEPTQRDLLEAVERQLKAANETAGPAVACVVVSRSEFYPRPASPPDYPGRLGGFDPAEFLKANPGKTDLTRTLNLADPTVIAEHGCGGGVVIDPAGQVLVNNHAIDGATKIYVHLPGRKGSYADIHAADGRSDLAVLKLLTPPPGLAPIKFGDARPFPTADGRKATVYPGKLVVLLMNPFSTGFGFDRPSAAFGALGNVRVRIPPPAKTSEQDKAKSFYHYGTMLETDIRQNPGVSGAALLNLDGELIGLTTAAAAVTGGETTPGYAIPIDDSSRRVIDVLRRGEEVEYGFLGVTFPRAGSTNIISDVYPQTPAEAAGLRMNDRIIRINGQPTTNYEDVLLFLGSSLAGSRVKMVVERGAVEKEVTVTLAKYQNAAPFIASVRPDPVFGLRVDHASILFQTIGQDPRAPIRGIGPGVVVREVVPNSPAAARFKALGDSTTRWLITQVNGTPVETPAEFYKAAKGQAAVTLTLYDPTDPNARPRDVKLP